MDNDLKLSEKWINILEDGFVRYKEEFNILFNNSIEENIEKMRSCLE